MNSVMHTQHPDIHEHGLADDCPACAQHAEDPIRSLDREMLAAILKLAVDRDRLSIGRSGNELVAAAKVLTDLERVGALLATNAEDVFAYFERWDVKVMQYTAVVFERDAADNRLVRVTRPFDREAS